MRPAGSAMTRVGRLESINRSSGGVPKTPGAEAMVTEFGLDGDQQEDLNRHGGPERAIVLYSLDLILALRREGHPIGLGTTGENLTVSGVEWTAAVPGAEVIIGPVRLRLTKFAKPCQKIASSFLAGDVTRVSHDAYAGWSRVCASVLAGGLIRVGDAVTIR